MRTVAAIALALALLPATVRAVPPPVGSEDYNVMHPFKDWVVTQHDQYGRGCCDLGDGRPVEAMICTAAPNSVDGRMLCGIDPKAVDDKWFAHITPAHFPGERDRWVEVPAEKIDPNANPTGMPILWLYEGRVQCFAPPNGA